MRGVFASFSVLAFLPSALPVSAADQAPARRPAERVVVAAPPYTWTGFYAGFNGGGGWGYSRFDFASGALFAPPTNGQFSVSGGMFGVTAGYNYQFGATVIGLEADGDWANVSGSSPCAGGVTRCGTKNTWLATGRGRVGFTMDRIWGYSFESVLPYVTGGVAAGGLRANVVNVGDTTATNAGWTLGAGIEVAILERWSAKAEYLFVDLGRFDCGSPCGPVPVNVHFTSHLVRGGVNYRF
jgi:outer membrane immunogenic protein